MTVLVIGGGAAGLMAAGTAAEAGAHVILLEKNEKVGRKLYITGKGRCNVTNDCDAAAVMQNTPVNPRFLYSALSAFPPERTKAFFISQGVALKTERGGRVFPASDRAADIIDALRKYVCRVGVKIHTGTVTEILHSDTAVTGVRTDTKEYLTDRIILATGGASYPATGSTGDGYRFARTLGHTVVPPQPSLIPLCSPDPVCAELMGLSLRNVAITVLENKKRIFSEQGEMMFTHFGVTGPLVLAASSHMRHFGSAEYRLEIDLKPALDEQTLDKRLLADFDKFANHDFINSLGDLLPRKFIPVMVERCGIDGRMKTNSVTKGQRAELRKQLKHFSIPISGARPIEEAIITSGGVTVREIDPKTMASRKTEGLYFAGEIIDVDAYTGGYNLQIAWATGYLAGQCAGRE